MAVKGVFASDQNIQGTRRGDFASALLQTAPTGSAPLLALSSGMQSKDAIDTVITWFEENHLAGRVSVTNNAGTGTTLTVSAADATQIVAGNFYLVEASGEYIFIDSVSGATLTVTRGFAGTSPAAIDGSSTPVPMQRIGTAHEEGSAKPTAVANIGFPRFNYMEIFRNAWDVTGTARAVEYLTGDIVAKNKRDAAMFHSEDIERALHFGRKTVGIQNGQPFRTMDGVRTQITTNVEAQATNVKWDDVDAFLQSVFSIGIKGKPNERIAFAGNTVIGVLNKIGRLDGVIELTVGQTDFGMEITKWRTPYGNITVLTHPLYNENPVWTKDLLVIHPGAMRTRWLRRTHEDNNDRDGTRAGTDADFGVITSELSVEYMAEATGGLFTGIDTAAATS
jgi:hypothetical protein